MTVLPFVLAAMAHLAPERDHAELGGAIARAVDQGVPLFAGEDGRQRTAALAVAVAFRESSLRLDAVGDKGKSFCAFQIHVTSGGSRELLTDADACASKGLAMLRSSFRICREHPIAWYAAGPRGCASTRAQRISRDRMALARRVYAAVGGDS